MRENILVLNADYTPLTVADLKRAFRLLFKGKAEVILSKGQDIVTDKKNYKRPSIIRLVKYIVYPYKKVTLCRSNIFRRDNHQCIYCGTKNNLTIDHVFPKSRGGQNTWTNLVTCCFRCNALKDNRTPEEANMKLSHKPFVPNYILFIKKMYKISDEWKPYLMIDKDE